MKKMYILLAAIAFCLVLSGQERNPDGGMQFDFDIHENCISPQMRSQILRDIAESKARFAHKRLNRDIDSENATVSFDWPLRRADHLTFNHYYGTSFYVDHDPGAGIQDHLCNSRSYDGHTGTDIFTWPFPWYLVENDMVEVIAAETGTIINKFDGEDDDHCAWFGDWNAVYIEHADGSVALYGHLKRNSLTTKSEGETVSKGEYLGIVASSGVSTDPHLHFEVHESDGSILDPYAGSCNTLNTNSLWASQPSYRNPTLNALLTHSSPPKLGCPHENESPNLSNNFVPGQRMYAAVYYTDQSDEGSAAMRIRRPDNTIWQNWTQSFTEAHMASYWWWYNDLPENAPLGTWSFEVDFDGQTYVHNFEVVEALPLELIHFDGEVAQGHGIQLKWSTSSEVNSLGFELERSTNGLDWSKKIFIKSADENSFTEKHYHYFDTLFAAGQYFYRLKLIDKNGSIEYSSVIAFPFDKNSEITIFPNPTSDWISINGSHSNNVWISNLQGHILYSESNINQINLSSFPDGIYVVEIRNGDQSIFQKVVKTH